MRSWSAKGGELRGDERNLGLDHPPKRSGKRHHVSVRQQPDVRNGQARKGTRWMPRHQEAMKDAATCEKPRGAGSKRRSVGIRMGKPGRRHGLSAHAEYIGVLRRTRGTETSKYPLERKSTETPLVVASECGRAQTSRVTCWGCGTPTWECDG